jgi:hypothetical protein
MPKRVYLSRRHVQLPPPIKIEQFPSGYFPVAIKIYTLFSKFDSIKDILEA